MSDDKQDPIIDSLLEEFLGDLKAPDLRERILGRAAAQPSARDSIAPQQPLANAEFETPRVERAPADDGGPPGCGRPDVGPRPTGPDGGGGGGSGT